MTDILNLIYTIATTLTWNSIIPLIIVIIIGLVVYLIIKIIDANIKKISKFIESKISSDDKEHRKAINYRKVVTVKIKDILTDLINHSESNSLVLFEYSNGNSNIAGLPFMFLNATQELNTLDCRIITDNFQKLNVSLFAEFLLELEESKIIIINDISEIKNKYPILYSILLKNKVRSAVFLMLDGPDSPLGVLVNSYNKITDLNDIHLKRDMINAGRKISALLNYSGIKKI